MAVCGVILLPMKRGRLFDLLLGTVLLSLYFIFAVLGLKINAVSGFATLVWVPTGLSLAFLFRFGFRFWPAVALGAFLANTFSGSPVLAAMGIAMGNTLEAVVGVYLIKYVVKLKPSLERVSDVLGLIFFAALISTLISATIGVASLWLNGVIELPAYGSTWLAWWSGDAVSDIVIASLIFVWSISRRAKVDKIYLLELLGLLLPIMLITLLIFSSYGQDLSGGRPINYLIFPLLVLLALRFGQRANVSAVFLLSLIAVWQTTHGIGPFAKGMPSTNLLFCQLYVGVVAITTMIAAAIISERREYESKKDEFISVASHELKTPLTSIKIFTQTLQLRSEKKGDKQSVSYLRRVNAQINKLSLLVGELLDVSRIQEGKMVLQKRKFNLTTLVYEVSGELSETSNHKIVIKGLENLQLTADKERIGQVITNLLSNAVKYSPDSKKIVIKLSKNADEVVVAVQDFGIGIDKNEQQHIFDRYYQAENKKSRSGASLGLGLYIAKEIVEQHGGRIWVKSSSAKGRSGSTFFFTLPLKNTKNQ